ARLQLALPADGRYTIELHDRQYAGPAPGFYRMKIGQFHYADQVFPPAVQRGKKTSLQLIGNIPPGKLVEFTSTGRLLAPAPWPADVNGAGSRPIVEATELTELIEQREGSTPQQLPAAPVGVSGRLDADGQQDLYRVPVKSGEKLRLEVFADRLGSPLDLFLEVTSSKGAARNDDAGGGTADPRLDYTVPAGVTSIDILIRAQVGGGDAKSIYRLAITPLAQKPSFRLKVASNTHNVPRGSTSIIQVTAERSGYNGPIQVSLDNVPPPIAATVVRIPAGSNGALLTLSGFGDETSHLVTRILGSSVGVDPPITAVAEINNDPLAKIQPWMKHEMAFALTSGNAVPFGVSLAQPPSATLALGSTMSIPVRLSRPPGAIGPVRLSLLVGQPAPIVNNKPDPNRAVRAKQATVEIPLDAKAKAALDAFAAADAAAVKARNSATSVKRAQAKLVADAVAIVKPLEASYAVAEKAAKAAEAQHTSVAASTQEISDEVAVQVKAAIQSTAGQATPNDADAKLKTAVDRLAAAAKALATTRAQVATTKTAAVAANKTLTDAQAKAKLVMDSANQQNAAAEAAVKVAETGRADAEKNLRAAEANIRNDVTFDVIVPPNLVAKTCDLALKAELRSLDNKSVLAEVFTPVRRLTPIHPLGVEPAARELEAKLDAKTGAVVKFVGKIERQAGFAGPVTVSFVGQPKEVKATSVVVKPDAVDFAATLSFPAGFKPVKLATIKLVATGPFDPAQPKIVVRKEAPITVNLLPADPPEKKE
ncbi:MAG: hypothetical protein QF805_23505, partial [Pirellulaceae bacterium]|nr:hypothetical protein [Pirellulaceae bacterium]